MHTFLHTRVRTCLRPRAYLLASARAYVHAYARAYLERFDERGAAGVEELVLVTALVDVVSDGLDVVLQLLHLDVQLVDVVEEREVLFLFVDERLDDGVDVLVTRDLLR